MTEFTYVAKDSTGRHQRGTIEAETRSDALRTLFRRSLTPLDIHQSRAKKVGRLSPRVVVATLTNLADLLDAGMPLLAAVTTLTRQTTDTRMARVLSDIREQLTNGSRLADSLSAHPAVFSALTVNIVMAGETGGFLEESIRRVASLVEQQEEIKSRVYAAMAYPAFLLLASTLVVGGLISFVVPNFAPLFKRMSENAALPLPTRVLLFVSDILQQNALICVVVVVAGLLSGWCIIQSQVGKRWREWAFIHSPCIGPILRQLAIVRFCSVMGNLLGAGVPILNALRIANEAIGNSAMGNAVESARSVMIDGGNLTDELRSSGQFPGELLDLMAVGEEANKLTSVLEKASTNYARQVNRRIDLFVKLLEPVLLLIMSCVILFLLLALLLPIFHASGQLG